MTALHIILDGDGAWPDLKDKRCKQARDISISGLPAGMSSGRPSVTIRMDMPDGQTVLGETSLRLLLTAADALKAKYGDPRLDDTGDVPRIGMGKTKPS